MTFTIPIYIEESRDETNAPLFLARPLFFREPQARGEKLNRVSTKLTADLRKELTALGRGALHHPLVPWTFSPELETHLLNLTIELRSGRAKGKFLLVALKALDRRVAFTPSLPELWFDLHRGQNLPERATEVLSEFFREQERTRDDPVKPGKLGVPLKAWTSALELDVALARLPEKPPDPLLAFLGGRPVASGAEELEKVGRCLDTLYPDELDRVVLRDREVEELTRLLSAADKRPVLLVGPRKAGKTAIIHEHVYRALQERHGRHAGRRQVWLLAPQRLISGMSFVGQWEERLLAILGEAKRRGHILYFDDVLGLFLAGISAQSNLNVAHVLKPFIERREVRVLAEITSEAFRVLQERDRGLADQFHLLPVRETNEHETLRVVVGVHRQIENECECGFAVDALPTVVDLQRRYVKDQAFPGKAAGFLRQLGIKYRGREILRGQVLEEFHAKSGIAYAFLDGQMSLSRQEIMGHLGGDVIGQDAAVQAVADVICVARARLNDPNRPLATFLFVGPTGVGKTQCAKATAKLLFGNADRLLRFDMNEFLTPDSVARLVGTFDQPEGLLTSAVRRQPFCVLLLDEIEKAHPDVFDLLLQVLGEGRLTDALGRTADFTNAIIIMTSNLGVREARSPLGFRADDASSDAQFVSAAEKFFRPEFFNRLDRVVPFRPLSRAHISLIANGAIGEVLQRHGLRQRKCMLRLIPPVMERIIEQGYHPQLGARALKRVIERQLAQPVAVKLAALSPGTPTVISVFERAGALAVQTQGLEMAKRREPPKILATHEPREVIERVQEAIRRIEKEIEQWQPRGPIRTDDIGPSQRRYFAAREQIRRVQAMCRRFSEQRGRPRKPSLADHSRARLQRARNLVKLFVRGGEGASEFKDVFSIDDLDEYLGHAAQEGVPYGNDPADQLADVLHEMALLRATTEPGVEDSADRVLLALNGLELDPHESWVLRNGWTQAFRKMWGLDCQELTERWRFEIVKDDPILNGFGALLIEGPSARAIASVEAGTHLWVQHESMSVYQATIVPLAADAEPLTELAAHVRSSSGVDVEPQPPAFGPVVRFYDVTKGVALDLRTGMTITGQPLPAEALRTLILSQLPLPKELENP